MTLSDKGRVKRTKVEGEPIKRIVIQNIALPMGTEQALEYYPNYLIYLDKKKYVGYSPAKYFNEILALKFKTGAERNEEAQRIAKSWRFAEWIDNCFQLYEIYKLENNI